MSSTGTQERKSYKSKYKPTWCPGCGDFSVLAALDGALAALGRPEHEICIVAGIGCSSRFPFFMETYGVHSAHGRALPVATGLKLARPDLQVVVVGGDGDALAIGGNHFFHAMRRNIDMTYLLMDNQIYGMTKGQAAPTSRRGMVTKSAPFGAIESPVDPVWAALTMGATFVAQAASFELKQQTSLILQALRHKGMAFVNILSPCVTFNKEMDKDYIKAQAFQLPEDYNPTDYEAALRMLHAAQGRFPLGLIHRREEPTLEEGLPQYGSDSGSPSAAHDGGNLLDLAREFF